MSYLLLINFDMQETILYDTLLIIKISNNYTMLQNMLNELHMMHMK